MSINQRVVAHPAEPEGDVVRLRSGAEFTSVVAAGIVRETRDAVERAKTLAEELAQARNAMELGTNTFQRDWVEWLDSSKTYLGELRMWSQACNRELKLAAAGMNDVREILGSQDFKGTIAQLRELVELCERAKALKESGFLDAVVDTLVKLPCKPHSET